MTQRGAPGAGADPLLNPSPDHLRDDRADDQAEGQHDDRQHELAGMDIAAIADLDEPGVPDPVKPVLQRGRPGVYGG